MTRTKTKHLLARVPKKNQLRLKRKKKILGNKHKPRVLFKKTGKHYYALCIDDTQNRIVFSLNSIVFKRSEAAVKTEFLLQSIAELFAKKMLDCKISNYVFDDNGHVYFGSVKTFNEKLSNILSANHNV